MNDEICDNKIFGQIVGKYSVYADQLCDPPPPPPPHHHHQHHHYRYLFSEQHTAAEQQQKDIKTVSTNVPKDRKAKQHL